MPRPDEFGEISNWSTAWNPEYQALFANVTDITSLQHQTETEDSLDLTEIESDFPPLNHYQDLARILSKYSILRSPPDDVENPGTIYRLGPSFPDVANPISKEHKSKYDQEAFYDLCKHINRLCETADQDSPVTKKELADSVNGWYPEEDVFGTFLEVLEEYQLLRKVEPDEDKHKDAEGLGGSEPESHWAIGIQQSANRT